MSSTSEADEELGRAAAERLCHEWPHLIDLVEVESVAFASAAVGRLAELIESQPALFQASRRGSELGAESLSARPFQGILETVQNADDLEASELRIAIRRGGRNSDLLLVHDGLPVSLLHVGAMVLPWVGTKRDDPLASGRFGIGQMTLRALGGPIEVHCHPFQFRMEEIPVSCSPELAIKDFYDPAERETLLAVPLKASVNIAALERFVTQLGTQSIVFLKSIRRLSMFDLGLGKRTIDHHLHERERRTTQVRIRGRTLPTEVIALSSPDARQAYLRYVAEVPISKRDHRRDKAESKTTQVGVSIPQQQESAGLYDRLPLPLPIAFPVGLNAQFDPDTARSTLHETSWNKHRFEELGELIGEVARDVAALEPRGAWSVIPLDSDVPDGITDWISERFRLDVVAASHDRIRESLKLAANGGSDVGLERLSYEESSLDRLLSDADQRLLVPDFEPMRAEWRDRAGRWRAVLEELEMSHRIEVADVLKLLDLDDAELGQRDVQWFIRLADAALSAEALEEWARKRGVLLADGRRVEPPGTDEPRSLVYRDEPNSLSSLLGLSLPIHAGYLTDELSAQRVRGALEDQEWLVEAFESDREALDLLARGEKEPIRLGDEALLTLRDAFERLSDEEQRELGPRIGGSVLLRTFSFDDEGGSREAWIGPLDAYLPKQIDREKDSFAVAAAQTPGLNWLSPHYAKVLKRSGGRHLLGAQKFLVRLGAQTQPRLVPPPNEVRPYVRDPRPVSPVQTWKMPELQVTEINSLGHRATHLLADRWSPDLDVVVADMQESTRAESRRRATALLAVLARGWERHYAAHAHTRAVWGYDGWNDRGEITATWLARLASEAWLPSMTGASQPPKDLHLLTEANKLTVGEKRALYMMKVDEQIMRSPVINALRIRRGPAASAVISRLEELRDAAASGKKVEAETRTAYLVLASNCPSGERIGRRPVDDITVAVLRNRFSARGGGRGIAGLLLINNQWRKPQDVLRGPPIFGRRRPFVLESQRLDPLWSTLGIDYPSPRDCLEVLRELSAAPLASKDESIVIESMRLLSLGLDEMTPQFRRTLRNLPLWDGEQWISGRPAYTLEDESLAETFAAQVPIWQAGFNLQGHEKLLEALGVTMLKTRDFKPVSGGALGAASGEDLRPRFTLAVEHLQAELARRDPILYESLQVPWNELTASGIIVDPELEVAAIVDGKRLIGATGAHLIHDPLTLFVRSESQLGLTEAGGRAIADLFDGDKQKVAWAWAAMWVRATEGIASQELTLASDVVGRDEEENRLIDLRNQTGIRQGRNRTSRAETTKGAKRAAAGGSVEIRKLKNLEELEPGEGLIVNEGAKRGGVTVPTRRPLREKSTVGPGSGSSGTSSSTRGKKDGESVLPPLSEREQLAYDAVRTALRLAEGQIADLRKEIGIGADAIDEMRQFFEIKMASSAEIPNEISLTPAEVERARIDPDFFLAVVAGLEETAGELRVRFIFNPLSRLPLKLRSDLTLGGVRDAEALEYVFRKSD